jgi:multidrug efflux pump subunit AcrB
MRDHYRALLERALLSRARFVGPFLAAMAASAILAFPMGRYLPGLGQDFFPSVDGGQIRLHLRARSGLRIDETAALCDQVEDTIRTIIPRNDLATIVDNVGVPYSGINLTYSTSAPIGPSDADIYISLNPHHQPSDDYVRTLRAQLPLVYPSTLFTYHPADIVSQILNFGLPAPLDIQVIGYNVEGNRQYANRLLERMRSVPGAVDLRIHQVFDHPQLEVDVDRSRAALLGVTERDVASNLLTSLSGSFQTTPSFWIDPKTGSQYSITAQTPQYRLASLSDLETTPLSASAGSTPQLLANLATFRRSVAPGVVNHYNGEPVVDIFGARHGSRIRLRADRPADRRDAARAAARHPRQGAGPDQDHDRLISRTARRPGRRGFADLSADRRQLPVLARSVHHHHRTAGGPRRHRLDAVPEPHARERSGADGRDHLHGRRHRQ